MVSTRGNRKRMGNDEESVYPRRSPRLTVSPASNMSNMSNFSPLSSPAAAAMEDTQERQQERRKRPRRNTKFETVQYTVEHDGQMTSTIPRVKIYADGRIEPPEHLPEHLKNRIRHSLFEIPSWNFRRAEDKFPLPRIYPGGSSGRVGGENLSMLDKHAQKLRRLEAYERLLQKAPKIPARKTVAQKKKASKVGSWMSKREDFPDDFAGYEAEVTIKNPRNAKFFQEHYAKNAEKMYEGMMKEAGNHAMHRDRKDLERELMVARELARRHPTPSAKQRIRTLREAISIQNSM